MCTALYVTVFSSRENINLLKQEDLNIILYRGNPLHKDQLPIAKRANCSSVKCVSSDQ